MSTSINLWFNKCEFIEKAIRFYSGYISAEDGMKYLPTAITSAMSGIVSSWENRMARLMFKLAVEMSMICHQTGHLKNAELIHSIKRFCTKHFFKQQGSYDGYPESNEKIAYVIRHK